MTIELDTFIERLDRWGADLDQWPAADAASAQALLRSSQEAAAALTRALTLAEMFDVLPKESAGSGLQARILDAVRDAGEDETDRQPKLAATGSLDRALDWLRAALWRPVAAATMVLLFGFAVGVMQPQTNEQIMTEELSLLALGDFEELPYE